MKIVIFSYMRQHISNGQHNISPYIYFTRWLINEFNADEAIWRKFEWNRKLRRLLKPKRSRKKQHQLDLSEFVLSRPTKDCIGFWGIKSFYPDFIIVRKSNKGFVVDILEPHDDTRTDAIPKAKGLAKFAEEHGEKFGRLSMARKNDERWQVVDVNEKNARERILKMGNSTDIESLFGI